MNSFNTYEDREKNVKKYQGSRVQIHTFNQSCFPRVGQESFLSLAIDLAVENDMEADFCESFQNSGLLDRQYCFLSNIDNLGATVNLKILNKLVGVDKPSKPMEFVMEVTDKTRADVKVVLSFQFENKLRLMKIVQVSKEHVDDLKSVKTFKIFKTKSILGESVGH